MHNKTAVIIEKDEKRFREIREKGITVVQGDGKNPAIYNEVQLSPTNYVVVLTQNDQENIDICKFLRQQIHHERIISKASKQGIEKKLKTMEVESFDSTRVIATTIENLILRPTTYHTLVESFENYSVEEIRVSGKEFDGKKISEIPFPRECTLMLVRRQNNMYIPHGDTILKQGDIINVFGTDSAFSGIKRILG